MSRVADFLQPADLARKKDVRLQFLGGGAIMPAPRFAVTDDDAADLLEVLACCKVGGATWCDGDYLVAPASDTESSSILLLYGNGVVGFYEGSCLWIHESHRGKGLATPLILAAALDRSGERGRNCALTVLPRDVDMHGYSPAGLAAHDRAFVALWATQCDLRRALSDVRMLRDCEALEEPAESSGRPLRKFAQR